MNFPVFLRQRESIELEGWGDGEGLGGDEGGKTWSEYCIKNYLQLKKTKKIYKQNVWFLILRNCLNDVNLVLRCIIKNWLDFKLENDKYKRIDWQLFLCYTLMCKRINTIRVS